VKTGKGSRQRLGFTLVEMLMVIIVVAVISAIAIPKVSQQIQLAKERSLRVQLRIARIAVERFYNDTGHYPQRMSWLNEFDWEVTPTFPGLTPDGVEKNLPANLYRGPYISDDSGNKRFTSQPNPRGGTYTHSAIKIIFDPISGKPFNCRLLNRVFTVTSSATGNDSNGVPYTSY
jgi:prepilin-type N-terminal cleavage/methylation domain-containing protein